MPRGASTPGAVWLLLSPVWLRFPQVWDPFLPISAPQIHLMGLLWGQGQGQSWGSPEEVTT